MSLPYIGYITEKDNIVRIPANARVYWAGKYSECKPNGSIEKFLKNINPNITILFTQSDGIVSDVLCKEVTQEFPYLFFNENNLNDLELKAFPKTVPFICALCTRDVNKKNILLLPLDDFTFEFGLTSIFNNVNMITWENRCSKLFWRGNPGGYERPTMRERVVTKLYDNLHSDCKFSLLGRMGQYAETIDKKYIVDKRSELQEFLQYKYLLIVDGMIIASNHQWVFGSGAVPIMVTHPKNNWWFKKFLIPMKHYVPISYDLSDLEEKLEWLVNNDSEAREIAENAVKFSKEVFSSDFQKKYIINQINESLCCVV